MALALHSTTHTLLTRNSPPPPRSSRRAGQGRARARRVATYNADGTVMRSAGLYLGIRRPTYTMVRSWTSTTQTPRTVLPYIPEVQHTPTHPNEQHHGARTVVSREPIGAATAESRAVTTSMMVRA